MLRIISIALIGLVSNGYTADAPPPQDGAPAPQATAVPYAPSPAESLMLSNIQRDIEAGTMNQETLDHNLLEAAPLGYQSVVSYLLRGIPDILRPSTDAAVVALDAIDGVNLPLINIMLLNYISANDIQQAILQAFFAAVMPAHIHIIPLHGMPPHLLQALLAAFDGPQGPEAQEAISTEKKAMKDAYAALMADERSSAIIKRYLPPVATTTTAFNAASRKLNQFLSSILAERGLSETLKFQILMSLRALRLLNGDDTIERHQTSPISHYQTIFYDGMPNIRQLFVLAYNLLKPKDKKVFVKDWMGETFSKPALWTEWATPFREKFPSVAGQANVGLALGADADSGNTFVQFILNSEEGKTPESDLTAGMIRKIIPFKKAYAEHTKDALLPIIEALFMVMRGHNSPGKLFDPTEANNPICALGVYLNILKAITQTPEIIDVAASKLATVEISRCDAPAESSAAPALAGTKRPRNG